MVIDTPSLRCFFCGRRFSPDREAAEGKFICAWRVAVCLPCLARDGIPSRHPAIRQLTSRGLVLKPSKDGLVNWPEEGGTALPARCRA